MSPQKLLACTEECYREGLAYFAGLGRKLLEHVDPAVKPLLDHTSDHLCLEPLLFAHFTARASPEHLLQIAFGYIEEAHRPRTITVQTNREGVVVLPNFGYLTTDLPNRHLSLDWDRSSRATRLRLGQDPVDHQFVSPVKATKSSIEISLHHHPLLDDLLTPKPTSRWVGKPHTRGELEHLNQALDNIRFIYPRYWNMIDTVTQRVAVFKNSGLNSFADLSYFGTAFLNISERCADKVFFIEDLVHQCGHILFSTLTYATGSFLTVPPETPLSHSTGAETEVRTVYGAFHGLFTEAIMNQCFDLCLETDLFSGRQRHELLGRFALIFRRFNLDLKNMHDRNLFTAKGALIYEYCREIFEDIYYRRRDLLCSFDLAEQPYSFSYEVFQSHNSFTAIPDHSARKKERKKESGHEPRTILGEKRRCGGGDA